LVSVLLFRSCTKGLSLNNSIPANDGACEVEQGHVGFECFLKTNQELAKTVHPRVASFDYPSSRSVAGNALQFLFFLAPSPDVGDVAMGDHRFSLLRSDVSGIGAEVDRCFVRKRDQDARQDLFDFPGIMHVCSGCDDREGNALAVHQKMPLGTFFFPDPWDSDRSLHRQAGLWSLPHRCFAIPNRCDPTRYRPSGPSSRRLGKSRHAPTAGNSGGWLRCRRNSVAPHSTGSRCEAHTGSLPGSLARIGRTPSSAGFPLILPVGIASRTRRDQGGKTLPQLIGQFPGSSSHTASIAGRQ